MFMFMFMFMFMCRFMGMLVREMGRQIERKWLQEIDDALRRAGFGCQVAIGAMVGAGGELDGEAGGGVGEREEDEEGDGFGVK